MNPRTNRVTLAVMTAVLSQVGAFEKPFLDRKENKGRSRKRKQAKPKYR